MRAQFVAHLKPRRQTTVANDSQVATLNPMGFEFLRNRRIVRKAAPEHEQSRHFLVKTTVDG
jgi:hypothetical protein